MITVNVEAMFADIEPWECSGSIAELGTDAGKITWGNAMRVAEVYLDWLVEARPSHTMTPIAGSLTALAVLAEQVAEDAKQTGAWEDAEIDAWTDIECAAYLAQLIARELCDCLDADEHECWGDVLDQYESTEWDSEPEYPIAHYYWCESAGDNGHLRADWSAGP